MHLFTVSLGASISGIQEMIHDVSCALCSSSQGLAPPTKWNLEATQQGLLPLQPHGNLNPTGSSKTDSDSLHVLPSLYLPPSPACTAVIGLLHTNYGDVF
jgi:hypothetical protein